MVFDFQGLNDVLQPVWYPLPHIPDMLREASAGRFFAKIDVASAYHQLVVAAAALASILLLSHLLRLRFVLLVRGTTAGS